MSTLFSRQTHPVIASGCVMVAFVFGCASLPVPQYPEATAFVVSEIAALAADGEFDFAVADFSDATENGRDIEQSTITFESFTRNIGFELGRRVSGGDAPPEGRFLGSPEHLRLKGAATIRLRTPATVLGMHLVLPAESAARHRWMEAGTETTLLVTGYDRDGNPTGTAKAFAAVATGYTTLVAEHWPWLDLSVLGEVSELRLTVESSLDELPVLLLDNVTISEDFIPDGDYFTLALLPALNGYVPGDLDIISSQMDYLRSERVVFVSHLGGLVSDPEDEEQWESVADLFGRLGRVPFGLVMGPGDFFDESDPSLGSPLFLEHVVNGLDIGERPSSGLSEDELSSYRVFTTPVGDVLSIHLAVDSPGETLQWAQSVVEWYRGMPTMITTAAYLDPKTSPARRLERNMKTGPQGTWEARSAQAIWEEFVSRNPQIFMVVSGFGSGEMIAVSQNKDEQQVVEMLAAYDDRAAGGEGYLRLLRFYPRRNEVRALTYSPWLDTYEQDPDSSFVVPMDIEGRLGLD